MLRPVYNSLNSFLLKCQKTGLHRRRKLVSNEGVINFSSSDYLSFSSDSRVQKAYQEGFQRYPVGSGGSMVVSGYHPVHQRLERTFAEALGVDQCLLFSSGYTANLSITALFGRLDAHVLIDKAVHASIYDGLKLSSVNYSRYLHNELTDLGVKMKRVPNHTVLMTESVFSMSGQITPLFEIAQLCRAHSTELIVDEAHAFGVIGHQGLGGVVQQQLTQEDVPLRMVPFGKAFAASGAIVAGQAQWIDALLQCARPYIYSTALSPALTYGLFKNLDRIRHADDRRAKLHALVTYFRKAVSNSPLRWRNSSSMIQQLQLGCPHRALSVSNYLRQQGIIALPMRQPTVSKQDTGLRITLNYHHEPDHIDYLFQCLHQKQL